MLNLFSLMAMMARVFRLGARSSTNRSLWSISLEVESSSCWGSKASCSGVKYRGGPEYGEVPPNRKIRLPTLVIACLRLGFGPTPYGFTSSQAQDSVSSSQRSFLCSLVRLMNRKVTS